MTCDCGHTQSAHGQPLLEWGGSAVLEHRYAATLLVHLLAGDRTRELGDNAEPMSVAPQANDVSPVDDMVISGLTPDGRTRKVSIGVRRHPAFTRNDAPTTKLLRTYLEVLTTHHHAVKNGEWLLVLAVVTGNPPPHQVQELATITKAHGVSSAFHMAVDQPKRTSKPVRARLETLIQLVADAATGLSTPWPPSPKSSPGSCSERCACGSCIWKKRSTRDHNRPEHAHQARRRP